MLMENRTLLLACSYEEFAEAWTFFENPPSNLNACLAATDENGFTALHFCCQYDACYDLILKIVTLRPELLTLPTNIPGELPLHLAAAGTTDPEVIKLLVRNYPEAFDVLVDEMSVLDHCVPSATRATGYTGVVDIVTATQQAYRESGAVAAQRLCWPAEVIANEVSMFTVLLSMKRLTAVVDRDADAVARDAAVEAGGVFLLVYLKDGDKVLFRKIMSYLKSPNEDMFGILNEEEGRRRLET